MQNWRMLKSKLLLREGLPPQKAPKRLRAEINPAQYKKLQLLLMSFQAQNRGVCGQDGSVGVHPKTAANQITNHNSRLDCRLVHSLP